MYTERGPPVQRQPLKHRDYEVDLESRLGKTQVCLLLPLSKLQNCVTLEEDMVLSDGNDFFFNLVLHYEEITFRK